MLQEDNSLTTAAPMRVPRCNYKEQMNGSFRARDNLEKKPVLRYLVGLKHRSRRIYGKRSQNAPVTFLSLSLALLVGYDEFVLGCLLL